MSRRPVLEEVDDEDIDNMDMDIEKYDPSLKTPIAEIIKPEIVRSQDSENINTPAFNPFPNLNQPSTKDISSDIVDPNTFTQQERDELSSFQILYPCYFDKNRSHSQGRRSPVALSVLNPLAKSVSDACRSLNLPVLLEMDKTHPQDFGNPGRVRVLIKSSHYSKRGLINIIGEYLTKHPTTISSITSNTIIPPEFKQGFTPGPIPKVKGFKMNTIVPVHSTFTLKHPMTKSIYDPIVETAPALAVDKPKKQQKMKVKRLRG